MFFNTSSSTLQHELAYTGFVGLKTLLESVKVKQKD